jgi:hypothetical protein
MKMDLSSSAVESQGNGKAAPHSFPAHEDEGGDRDTELD